MEEDGKTRIGGSSPIPSIFRKGVMVRTVGKASTADIVAVLRTMIDDPLLKLGLPVFQGRTLRVITTFLVSGNMRTASVLNYEKPDQVLALRDFFFYSMD
jgi:hypothetical protein